MLGNRSGHKTAGKKKTQDEKLTPKAERFVHEYCIDQNGAAAAVRAGYSEKSGKTMAYQLLQKPVIQAAIAAAQDAALHRADITMDQIVAETRKIAFRDLDKCLKTGAQLMAKLKALIALGQHLGGFGSKVELSGPGGSAIIPVLNVTISGNKPGSAS